MNQEKQKQVIEKYVEAYNNFDTETMLSLFDSECSFENYSGDELTSSAKGLAELRAMMEQGKNVFVSRRQIISALSFQNGTAIAEIDYQGKLKIDLPNGLKAGDDLKLKGRSEFEFQDGLIKSLKDFS
ncbi:MAG: nuclear transport factor 2 family protein [Acidobacteriota bacterium]|nr:nuclear transport factor 2 family protein [Acidobacteriota bacterium]